MVSLSKRSRVFVTGINGFTGRYLAERMRLAGYDVSGTYFGSSKYQEPSSFYVDIRSYVEISEIIQEFQPDIVVHLAGISSIDYSDTETMYAVNVLGTQNLLEALGCLSRPPRLVLLASSANVYGNTDIEQLNETVRLAPSNDYALSKMAMEELGQNWSDRLPIVIARPFNYTGVGQSLKFLIPKIVRHFQLRLPSIELGNLEVERDFSDVRSIVEYYIRIIEASPVGQIINIGSGQLTSIQEIVSMVAEISGFNIDIRLSQSLTRKHDIKRLKADITKLIAITGKIEVISIYETLKWMYYAKSFDKTI